MRPDPLLVDQWSFYDYKPVMQTFGTTQLAPSWIPNDERRRLTAYMLLSAYVRNNGRAWMPTDLTEDEILGRREYGEAATLIDSVVSSVVGEEQKILVKGALDEDPPNPGAVLQQKTLEVWAKKERLLSKMLENERTTAELGDGVYVLGWDENKGRPRLRVYDPGFYFPVLDEDDTEFPSTIHLCWEFERTTWDNKIEKWLRRITWTMVDLPEPVAMPWKEELESDATQTCVLWDGEWRLEDVKEGMYDLSDEKAVWRVQGLDLGLDFIPVIHLPNTVSEQEHFGISTLARVMQILDDIASTDTDLQASSATTGSPPLAITGTNVPTDDKGRITTYGPGTVLKTGDGNATMIDTSRSLNALLEYDKHLLSRLSVNSRIPEALLGRVKPNEVPSGIALTLSFTPHANLIKEMRLVRRQKYELLMKFVSRMYMKAGLLSEIYECGLWFGSFLPADKSEASTLVSTLYRSDKPIISIDTALELLIRSGFPIEEAQEEIRKIRADDFESANRLLDATGDTGLVYEYLDRSASAIPVADGTVNLTGLEGEQLPDGTVPES